MMSKVLRFLKFGALRLGFLKCNRFETFRLGCITKMGTLSREIEAYFPNGYISIPAFYRKAGIQIRERNIICKFCKKSSKTCK